VLWRCWLGGRKGIQPIKTEWWGAGVLLICLQRGADLHMAQLMPLPLTVSCFSNIQIDFTFLVPAQQGSPGQRAIKRACVCVKLHKRKQTATSCLITKSFNNNNNHHFTAIIQVNLRRILLVQSFTACMPLLTATSALWLGRRCWSSPQQC